MCLVNVDNYVALQLLQYGWVYVYSINIGSSLVIQITDFPILVLPMVLFGPRVYLNLVLYVLGLYLVAATHIKLNITFLSNIFDSCVV